MSCLDVKSDMWSLSQDSSSLPFMFALTLFFFHLLPLPKTAKLDWYARSPEESCMPATSPIGLQCVNCWHLRTQDLVVERAHLVYYPPVDVAFYGFVFEMGFGKKWHWKPTHMIPVF